MYHSWQSSCRYVCIVRKLNSINPVCHNLSICGGKSSFLSGILNCSKYDNSISNKNISSKPGVGNPNRFLGRIWENFQKYRLVGPHFGQKHPKYRKITEFQSTIGPQKFLSKPHAARGPRIGHPWPKLKVLNAIRGLFYSIMDTGQSDSLVCKMNIFKITSGTVF